MKQQPMPFQAETVKAAVDALTHRGGSHRFLVADEVGLGKTVVARSVIQALAQRARQERRTFTVFYFASNLELLEQNRKSIRKAADSLDGVSAEDFSGDRLGSYLLWCPMAGTTLRIAVFTPGTSLPDRARGAAGTGTRDERALAVALANLTCPVLINRRMRVELAIGSRKAAYTESGRLAAEDFEARIRNHRTRLLKWDDGDRRSLLRAFWRSLADEFGIDYRAHTAHRRAAVKKLFDGEGVSFLRAKLRCALCRAALHKESHGPDLVILDEFQRYRDMLDEQSGSLTEALFRQSKVLLLSATPFAQPQGAGHSHPLIELVRFLYATSGSKKAAEIEQALTTYRHLIAPDEGRLPTDGADRDAWTRSVLLSKSRLEELLRPIIERTERSDDSAAAGVNVPPTLADVEVDDLRVFDDFANRLRSAGRKKNHRSTVSHATPLWLSVPYPVQTLPSGYVASAALHLARGIRSEKQDPKLSPPPGQRPPSGLPPAIAHPKLRALLEKASKTEELALPWICPSLPWWQLNGIWKRVGPSATKSLVFTHFRATPPAIGALVSREVERCFGSRRVSWDNVPRQGRFATGGRKQPLELLALYYPWAVLIEGFDPSGASSRTLEEIFEAARSSAELLLGSAGITVKKRLSRRVSLPLLLATLEQRKGQRDELKIQYTKEFAPLLLVAKDRLTEVGPREVSDLARFMVGAPGVVLGRALLRHYQSITPDICHIQEVSWDRLRVYLGRRYFERAIPPVPETSRRPSRHADRMGLLAALANGNLESVLDEQLFAWRRIGSLKEDSVKEALNEFDKVLSLPAGGLSLHHVVRGKRGIRGRLRAHAGVAFSGQETGPRRRGSKAELRPATVRSAFNSPFWPHLLATTAVGQEGLDFHLWCRRIVHWDIPPDPLSLEQREGRIMRYACLAVRRALALEHGTDLFALKAASLNSPWLRLGILVDELHSPGGQSFSRSGLAPWWVTTEGTQERILPILAFSRDADRFKRLLSELDLYRLAIGQPNPEQFVSRLDGLLTGEELRQFAIDLSSAKLRAIDTRAFHATSEG